MAGDHGALDTKGNTRIWHGIVAKTAIKAIGSRNALLAAASPEIILLLTDLNIVSLSGVRQ
jgi:hypothetical protein